MKSYTQILKQLAEQNTTTVEGARRQLTQLSFGQYVQLHEAPAQLVPPSGNTVGTKPTTAPTAKPAAAAWQGQGTPVERGMSVNIPDDSGHLIPGEVAQVDTSAKGVKVKNPVTGQMEWQNMDELGDLQGPDGQLTRLKELAGISENASAGATGAGAIAVANAPVGKMQTRQPTMKKEYERTEPAETVIGDTKPNQASGELSANLAASGKRTANRQFNGFRK